MNYTATLPVAYTYNKTAADSQIILKIYQDGGGFVFSVNAKLGRFIQSYYPNPNSPKFPNKDSAERSAVNMIRDWAGRNKTKQKCLSLFPDLFFLGQPTLFDL